MNNLFDIKRKQLFSLKKKRIEKINGGESAAREQVITCNGCKKEHNRLELKKKYYVCPDCGYHNPLSAKERISEVIDKGTFKELNPGLISGNPLKFPGYKGKIRSAQEKSRMKEAIVTGVGEIDGMQVTLAVMDSNFMMGSMGTVVGEKFSQAVEYAMKNKLPFICFATSGGARMQEGMFSLMQMAKTSAVVKKFSDNGGFYISVLTHPTMGGVSASFAMLGDIVLAEPGALIGFAGPRVIEQTINEKLPKGFQRSEFQEEHGFVDKIVPRVEMKKTLSKLIYIHTANREWRAKEWI